MKKLKNVLKDAKADATALQGLMTDQKEFNDQVKVNDGRIIELCTKYNTLNEKNKKPAQGQLDNELQIAVEAELAKEKIFEKTFKFERNAVAANLIVKNVPTKGLSTRAISHTNPHTIRCTICCQRCPAS
jgi:hypothetical protein